MAELLNVFDRFLDRVSISSFTSREDILVCGLQHILPSQEQLFTAIRRAGIARTLPVIIGKIYSTVRGAVPPESYLVHEPLELAYQRGEFEMAFKGTLEKLCQHQGLTVSSSPACPVIILDDGGFVSGFLVKYFSENGHKVVVVEQTTSGIRRARGLKCPVISVAGSILKRDVESLFVAECSIKALGQRSVVPQPGGCWCVAGFGAVGAAVCRELKKQGVSRILVYDESEALRSRAAREGFVAIERAHQGIEIADVLLGCTGENFAQYISPETINRKRPELICASCGSSDLEFGRWISSVVPAKLGRSHGFVGGNAFMDIKGSFNEGSYRVLNGGFPINLDRRPQSDPERDFVLTRMLMFAGALQGASFFEKDETPASGLVPLKRDFERLIYEEWLASYPTRLPSDLMAQMNAALATKAA